MRLLAKEALPITTVGIASFAFLPDLPFEIVLIDPQQGFD